MRLLNPEPKSTKESPTLDTGGAVPKVHCVKLTLQSSWLLQLSDFEKCSFILNDSFGDSKCTFVYWKLWEFCRRETSLTSFETGQFTERSISDVCLKPCAASEMLLAQEQLCCCPSHAGPQEALWGLNDYIHGADKATSAAFPLSRLSQGKKHNFPLYFESWRLSS